MNLASEDRGGEMYDGVVPKSHILVIWNIVFHVKFLVSSF